MEALPTAAKRSNDAIDEEKADGAALLSKSVPHSDDDRAEEKPAVKSAVVATPGPVKKVQLLNAAKSTGLDDEVSQRLWDALLEEVSAAATSHVSEAGSRSYWSAVAADVAKAAACVQSFCRAFKYGAEYDLATFTYRDKLMSPGKWILGGWLLVLAVARVGAREECDVYGHWGQRRDA